MTRMQARPPSHNSSLAWLHQWIEQKTGLVFEDNKITLLNKRAEQLCGQLQFDSIDTLVKQLKSHPSPTLTSQVIDIATINHTHFFRETSGMAFFINRVIPTLKYEKKICIWSAAASSGAELYTLLLMLTEQFTIDEIRNRFMFFGTDVNPKIIEQASLGIYSTRQLSEIPPNLRQKWFNLIGHNQWQVKDELSRLCQFQTLNLLDRTWPFRHKFHIIFLRNVLYYFSPERQQHILESVYDQALPSGWLITSVTENHHIDSRWRRIKAGTHQKAIGS